MKRILALSFLIFLLLPVYSQTSDDYNKQGKAKLQKGDYSGAITEFNNAILLNSSFYEAYYNRGQAKSKVGNHHGAIMDFSKAIEINPNYSEAYCERGLEKYLI